MFAFRKSKKSSVAPARRWLLLSFISSVMHLVLQSHDNQVKKGITPKKIAFE
jgi:hypothetical protein